MSESKDVFALIYASGRAETILGNSSRSPLNDYWQVLAAIDLVHSGSGFSSDHPRKLLRNGEVISEKPIDDAWKYTNALNKARDLALRQAREDFAPAWMAAAKEPRP